MTQELTIALAVEKVLFRLALLEGGAVPIVRAFLELPLALEVLEHEADKCSDGAAIMKDEWGEFLGYSFPELQSAAATMPAPPQDCPTCGRPLPESPKMLAPVEGQPAPSRGPLICEPCYRTVRRASQKHDAGYVDRIKHFFKGEEEEQDLHKIALVEHEILYIAYRLNQKELTHTAIAAQTRLASAQVKERLDRLAGRRYIRVGLLPSGDALAYRFPTGLSYPENLYRRVHGAVIANAGAEDSAAAQAVPDKPPGTARFGGLLARAKQPVTNHIVKARPADRRDVEIDDSALTTPSGSVPAAPAPAAAVPPPPPPPPPPPAPPPAPRFNIKVKDKRERGTPRPPAP